MLVVDLHCSQGHHFEGWFASADDLSSQKARGLLTCPVCGDHEVTRLPSAPHLNTSGLKERLPAVAGGATGRDNVAQVQRVQPVSQKPVSSVAASERPAHDSLPAEAQEAMAALQALYLKAVRHVVEHTEDVGERFADEARSIHHGDAPERAIRGQATEEEKQALREEGIDILSMPIPEGFEGPLQ
ncbi:hypothetical protein JY96_04030 [Aquabacterium sp. NJ1]|uniref:DUF1178 family protein n=1 Tax=Aquabacterium sp. NJ1 TaxID=1538295 RepID=UPI00052DA760|nr:DUF1178 family protein [Aquabacterium sp. NJ1]KGM39460.1 hypothetical protein JY96_04030 [Aquabacterium sp. NJ1]